MTRDCGYCKNLAQTGLGLCRRCFDRFRISENTEEAKSFWGEAMKQDDLVSALRLCAEKAEKERDEARALAVWAIPLPMQGGGSGFWGCCAPGGLALCWTDDHAEWRVPDDVADLQGYGTKGEALAAGRAKPWWEVEG